MRQLADVLAALYYDAGQARVVLTRIGFPPSRIPAFNMPTVFWSRVTQELESGLLANGHEALLDEALRQYPHNEKLKALRASVGAGTPSPAPVPTSAPVSSSRGLSQDWIMRVYQAGLGAGLPAQRKALVGVLAPNVRGAMLPEGSVSAAATLMADLGTLNDMATQGNPGPLGQWLSMAKALASAFHDAASTLEDAATALGPHPS